MSPRSMGRERSRRQRRARSRSIRRAAAGLAAAGALCPATAAADSVVTNKNDAGAGSLRQALVDSNAAPDADTITFAPSVTGTLTVNSELTALYSTTIMGPGASALTVRAPSSRAFFFYAFAPATLELDGITVTGASGAAPGGGIAANCIGFQGTVVLRDAAITASTTGDDGAGIFSDGCDLTLTRSAVSGNSATAGDSKGGGIHVLDAPGGGSVEAVSVVDSRISGNASGDAGAGLFVNHIPTAALTISRSTISGNVSNGVPGSFLIGGGVYVDDGGPISIGSSTFSANASEAGGGMMVADQHHPFTVRNSTFSGNAGQGGGLYLTNKSGDPFTIANSTIAGNTAGDSDGGGIYMWGLSDGDDLTLTSTIVANNTAQNAPDIFGGPSSDAGLRVSHSLIGSTSGSAPITAVVPGSNVLNAGPVQLGPLADNGGPTTTMLPAAAGPAIDAGVANGLTTDQRGLARTVQQPGGFEAGDGTDIGAVELADSQISGAQLKAKRKQRSAGRKVAIKLKVKAAEDVSVQASGSVEMGRKTIALSKPKAAVPAGSAKTLKLKPGSKSSARKLLRYLESGRKAKASVKVRFSDSAGNDSSLGTKVTLAGGKR